MSKTSDLENRLAAIKKYIRPHIEYGVAVLNKDPDPECNRCNGDGTYFTYGNSHHGDDAFEETCACTQHKVSLINIIDRILNKRHEFNEERLKDFISGK